MDAAVAGLVGAAIGALASGAGVWVQQFFQGRPDRQRMAVHRAMAEYGHDVELARAVAGGAHGAPLAVYAAYYAHLADAFSKGAITPEDVQKIVVRRNATVGSVSRLLQVGVGAMN